MVVILSGGTGGAKLARGLQDAAGPDRLTVVANTADDAEVYGVHVSPDPDLVTYWLADIIDARGYGVRDDTWEVMDALEAAGRQAWFRLGDRDLAMCLVRTERLRAGERLTDAHAEVVRSLGVHARVLPMADEPVRAHVRSGGRWLSFQEFMILGGREAPVEGFELRGVEVARPSPEVMAALRDAEAIVIGPSNPVASIGPILALAGMREAIGEARAPVVAVSPFVDGRVLKGPTDAFCRHAGIEASARGIATAYSGLIDGLVADEPPSSARPCGGRPAHLQTDTLIDTTESRARLARRILEFAHSLAG